MKVKRKDKIISKCLLLLICIMVLFTSNFNTVLAVEEVLENNKVTEEEITKK